MKRFLLLSALLSAPLIGCQPSQSDKSDTASAEKVAIDEREYVCARG